ncbi:MAG: purine-binding chemotaxis protein CheW [candidate division Zixibacteria bacterium]|nr:purine-binding chemotaxis protein CheW [candidate division Zixibacteria bacterium]
MSSLATFAETKESAATGATRAGKYLTFRLAAEEYGLKILKVREIIGLMPITKMPEAPACIRGIINLRGRVIPVLERRARFGMAPTPDNEETCIIVVDLSSNGRTTLMGILVDAVSEVLDIKADEIQDSPALGGDVSLDFILGIGKVKGGVKILLDIDKVITTESVGQLPAGLSGADAETKVEPDRELSMN